MAARNLVFQLAYFVRSRGENVAWLAPALPAEVEYAQLLIDIRPRRAGSLGQLSHKIKGDAAELDWLVSHRLMECDDDTERSALFQAEVQDIFTAIQQAFDLPNPAFASEFSVNPEFTVID